MTDMVKAGWKEVSSIDRRDFGSGQGRLNDARKECCQNVFNDS